MTTSVTPAQFTEMTLRDLKLNRPEGLQNLMTLLRHFMATRVASRATLEKLLIAFAPFVEQRARIADPSELELMSSALAHCFTFWRSPMNGEIGRKILEELKWPSSDPGSNVFYKLFNNLYAVIWKTCEDHLEGSRYLRDKLIAPFSGFLGATIEPAFLPLRNSNRIAYLINEINFNQTFAPGKLYTSWWSGHETGTPTDAPVFIYTLRDADDETRNFLASLNHVTVRSCADRWRKSPRSQAVKALRELCDADQIDTVIFEKVSATMLAIMHSRIAPVQLFSPMSFVPLLSSGVDGFLLTDNAISDAIEMGVPPEKIVVAPFSTEERFLTPPREKSEIEKARATLPPATMVFGTFARGQKISPIYASVVRTILEACPDSAFFAAGSGDQGELHKIFRDAGCPMSRISLLPVVDVHVYGKLIDVYLETFPIAQGLAAVEVAAKGIPVVHHKSPGLNAIWEKQRDPRCVVETVDEYVRVAVMLASDPNTRAAYGEVAREIVRPVSDVEANARALERAVLAFAASRS